MYKMFMFKGAKIVQTIKSKISHVLSESGVSPNRMLFGGTITMFPTLLKLRTQFKKHRNK